MSSTRAETPPEAGSAKRVAGLVALSDAGPATLAKSVPQPIHWAGPRAGYLYELKRTTDGSVHLAYPNVDYQVEVYDPSPARALAVAESGKVQPAG